MELHLVSAGDLRSQLRHHLAVDGHHACLDELIGLPAGADASVRQELIQADWLIGVDALLDIIYAFLGIVVSVAGVETMSLRAVAALSVAATTRVAIRAAIAVVVIAISTAGVVVVTSTGLVAAFLLAVVARMVTAALLVRPALSSTRRVVIIARLIAFLFSVLVIITWPIAALWPAVVIVAISVVVASTVIAVSTAVVIVVSATGLIATARLVAAALRPVFVLALQSRSKALGAEASRIVAAYSLRVVSSLDTRTIGTVCLAITTLISFIGTACLTYVFSLRGLF